MDASDWIDLIQRHTTLRDGFGGDDAVRLLLLLGVVAGFWVWRSRVRRSDLSSDSMPEPEKYLSVSGRLNGTLTGIKMAPAEEGLAVRSYGIKLLLPYEKLEQEVTQGLFSKFVTFSAEDVTVIVPMRFARRLAAASGGRLAVDA